MKNNFQPRICQSCGKKYIPQSGGQKSCGSIKNKIGCSYFNQKYKRHLTSKHGFAFCKCGRKFRVVKNKKLKKYCSKKCNYQARKGKPIPWLQTKKVRKKIGDSQRGIKKSEKARENMKKNYKYHTNKTCFQKGIIPWNKGLTKETHEGLRKVSEWMKKNNPMGNHIWTEKELKLKKLRSIENYSRAKYFKETKIEIKIEEELKIRNINYQKQVPLCKIAVVDFYLPEHRIIIECDGCFWHGCPIHKPGCKLEMKEKDKRKDRILTFNGFNVYRFWEHEINASPKKCIDKLNLF